MNKAWLLLIGLACGFFAGAWPWFATHLRGMVHTGSLAPSTSGSRRVHTEERFSVIVYAPMERVMPLFGADKERVWAPEWNPQFVYPVPAADVRGMVFTLAHKYGKSVWLNTQFDWKNGRVQYVYVIPDALATLITLQLYAEGDKTRVEVDYDRTALSTEADTHVRQLAERDRTRGPEWERQIGEYLAKRP